jgi:hypothetical protein
MPHGGVSGVTSGSASGCDVRESAGPLAGGKEDPVVWNRSRTALRIGLSVLSLSLGLVLLLAAAPASAARCDRADARLATTGKGDRDGDGISNCRERIMRTSASDADSDDDGMDDGDEMAGGCDPLDSDSDDDGVDDGDDETPAAPPRQEVKALVDALVCPTDVAPGSITTLGIVVAVDAATEFEDETCEELAARFAAEGTALVEIEIREDEAGGLTALEVEAEDGEHGDHHGDDDGEDDDDDGDDEGADEEDDD